MPKLNVNIDHIATLRQARLGKEPSVIDAAKLVEKAGADGITVHLREDRRHILDKDVYLLRKIIKTKLNLEMAAVSDIIDVALKVKPDWITLVPEKRRELTTEGGLNLTENKRKLKNLVKKFHNVGILVSFFVDADKNQIKIAKEIEGDFVEIHTGRYADAKNKSEIEREFKKIKEAAIYAKNLNLGINAGHGLNYTNIKKVVKIKEIEEFSIGHSIISRAVFLGIYNAVKEMINTLKE
ncbi:MAG: pyridoxine 5'-phosphate synthase [Candidatus Firestonebacteria bacterium]